MAAVRSKKEMYALLAAGRLGAAVPQFFDLASWRASDAYARYDLWGVRSMVPSGYCGLYLTRGEVPAHCARVNGPYNVSAMADAVCTVTAWLEVWDAPDGLTVYGVEWPGRGASWRQDMPAKGRHWRLSQARQILRRHLWPGSHDDLMLLLEQYPGHVVELSATDRQWSIPGRNAVVWEVRCGYSGDYEINSLRPHEYPR